MNQSPSLRHAALKRLEEKQNVRGNKLRLLGLFLLFDVLLFVAIILSFQTNELVHEEITLEQTREVYDIRITEQVITHTTVMTQVMPYGWVE